MTEIGVDANIIDDIVAGRKTIEVRLGKPKFLKVEQGDSLKLRKDVWENGKLVGSEPTEIKLKVTTILYFETFTEMFESLNYKVIMPAANSVEDALEMYGKYYSLEDELEYGVVAFLFDVL